MARAGRVGCSQKAPKTEASELAEAVSDTAKAMAGYKKGAAKLGAAATHSLQKDQQQLAEEMADGARESGKAFEQTFNLNPPPEGYEVVTTCADVDEEGHCWKTTNELQKPVRFEDAEPTDLNIKLGDSCTQELLDTFFANQVSKVVTYAMANAAESENVRSAMPVASLRGARCCGERERRWSLEIHTYFMCRNAGVSEYCMYRYRTGQEEMCSSCEQYQVALPGSATVPGHSTPEQSKSLSTSRMPPLAGHAGDHSGLRP